MWLSNVLKNLNKFLLAIGISLFGFSGCSNHGQEITVYAASSLTEVVSVVVEQYEKVSNVKAKTIFGGSNHLAAQLRDGAPVDVFITADFQLLDGLGFNNVLKDFAQNSLVVIKPRDFADKSFEPKDLQLEEKLIAICSEGVPCGDATRSRFGIITADTYELNVKGVLARVAASEVDLGIVYETDLKNEPKVVSAWPQEKLCPCVSYTLASKGKKGDDFSDFLNSETTKETFSEHGFSHE
tara:strand:+ start:378 stop:1097 length:720 start_codon:yes stop_codon:yes gene_type:complete